MEDVAVSIGKVSRADVENCRRCGQIDNETDSVGTMDGMDGVDR